MSVNVKPTALAGEKVRTWLMDLDRGCVSSAVVAMFSARVFVTLQKSEAERRVEHTRHNHLPRIRIVLFRWSTQLIAVAWLTQSEHEESVEPVDGGGVSTGSRVLL